MSDQVSSIESPRFGIVMGFDELAINPGRTVAEVQTEAPTPWVMDEDIFLLNQSTDAMDALLRAGGGLPLTQSWRKFRASACGITEPDEELVVSYVHGVNQKPNEDDPTDIHAEEDMLDQCEQIARRPINVLALVADVQPDETTGFDPGTLVPCYRRCLPKLESSPFVTETTLVLGGNPDLTRVHYYDIPTLRRAHETNSAELLTEINFEYPYATDLNEWCEKLLAPLSQRGLRLVHDRHRSSNE